MKSTGQRIALFLAVLCLLSGGPVQAQEDESGIPAVELSHHQQGRAFEWWTHEGIDFGYVDGVPTLVGNGRLILHTRKEALTLRAADTRLRVRPRTTVFVDHVDGQVRIMVLRGKATVEDGERRIPLTTSLQAVVTPAGYEGLFINDGVYRRPVRRRFEGDGTHTLVRQFYLEQVIYADPMLRTLYAQGGDVRELIRRLNKTGAIIRQLDGLKGYEEGQV